MRRINLRSLNRQARAARDGQQFIPGCTGKRRYDNGSQATLGANFVRATEGKASIYRCEHCEGWHVTSHWEEQEQ